MKVKINGERIVDVPQKNIKQGVDEFGLSEIDSARMYLEDEGYIFPEDKSRIELTEEKPVKHNAASATQRKKSTRERKVDEGKKYSLNIICDIADKNIISKLKGQEKITVIGTVTGYDYESPKQVGTLYLSNCFAEQ